MRQTSPTVQAIHRYPVKGLSAEPLPAVDVSPGETLPGDRLYAIENGPSAFDPAAPRHQPKIRYLMLMKNERLAALRTSYDDDSRTLTVRHNGGEDVKGDLGDDGGRRAIEQFFADYCADEMRGALRVLNAPGFSFSDVAAKVVSIINLASVAELADKIGAPIDPLRFRGNLHVAGWAPWREFDLLGQEIALGDGDVRLKVVKRIVRCAATNVDPQTGARDLTIPASLMQAYGHADCGVYAQVIRGGRIAVGDRVIS